MSTIAYSDPDLQNSKIANFTKAVGLDVMHQMVIDQRIRNVRGYDGVMYLSLVDLMSIFGEDNRKSSRRKKPFNPNSYWNDLKRALIAKDSELSDSIRQLKLPARDGKMYLTDVAPLWACLFVILLMDTPAATHLKKSLAKGTANVMERSIAEVKYRAMNIAKGMEWAADEIHERMKVLEPPPFNEK